MAMLVMLGVMGGAMLMTKGDEAMQMMGWQDAAEIAGANGQQLAGWRAGPCDRRVVQGPGPGSTGGAPMRMG